MILDIEGVVCLHQDAIEAVAHPHQETIGEEMVVIINIQIMKNISTIMVHHLLMDHTHHPSILDFKMAP